MLIYIKGDIPDKPSLQFPTQRRHVQLLGCVVSADVNCFVKVQRHVFHQFREMSRYVSHCTETDGTQNSQKLWSKTDPT